MKILLTGANGYIGQRLIPLLFNAGHEIVALVRSARRLNISQKNKKKICIIEGDLLDPDSIENIPCDVEIAYYLVHSMSHSAKEFSDLEEKSAKNFLSIIQETNIRQIIYLSGLVSDQNLSQHLLSRKRVEDILQMGQIPVTTLRAGIILGSGSASFEIMRDLVEKLPVMVAPKWVKNRSQPIGIYDVLEYLILVIDHPGCKNQTFDIGGPDVMTYKEMLEKFAELRGLKRHIITVPVLTPKLSSYWLYFVTSTNFSLAKSLVESLKNHAVCMDQKIQEVIPKKCLSFEESIKRTFDKIEANIIDSSWKDALVVSDLQPNLLEYIQVPKFGCLIDEQRVCFTGDPEKVLDSIWKIGGNQGWYYMNWAWVVRGWIDSLFGGVGLRRGRTHPLRLRNGDALDFWRVLLADRKQKRLLLYAEMRLPGEAWLEFKVVKDKKDKEGVLLQRATFRPSGLLGRLYWYSIYPFHALIFSGMARSIVRYSVTVHP